MNLEKLIAAFGFIGYLPFFPGTWMSLLTILGIWFLGVKTQLVVFVALTLLGFWVCAPAERAFGTKDPKYFVIDEASGMLLGVLLLPKTVALYSAAFVLFRFLDIVKPFFIRSIQKSAHPSSIMWDDLAAGALTNLVLQLVIRCS